MRILIIKTSSLGDIIHCFTSLSYLRKRFPSAQIHWVAERACAPLLQSHQDVDQVLSMDSKKWRRNPFKKDNRLEIQSFRKRLRQHVYDAVFDLQGNIKSSLILSLTRGKEKIGFSLKSCPEWPNIFFTHFRYTPELKKNIRLDYLSLIQQHFKDPATFNDTRTLKLKVSQKESKTIENILSRAAPSSRKVLIAHGSAWENKQITLNSLMQLMQKIHLQGAFFFIAWGNEKEKANALEIHKNFPKNSCLLDKISLGALQNLMHEMDLCLAMDSLALHLCGTTPVSTWSFFGPSRAEKYKPLGTQHLHFQGTCPYGKTFTKRCPILRSCPTGACLKNQRDPSFHSCFFSQ